MPKSFKNRALDGFAKHGISEVKVGKKVLLTDHKHEMLLVLIAVTQVALRDENYDRQMGKKELSPGRDGNIDHLITRAFEIMDDYKNSK